ncbi:hypothetical protein P8C59_008891 [Phyllachora maydis]|uniref:Nitrogen regulatory protein areA GATA-like domain-containing protein n=1 Tax=Phyllachora maydis TaxID=1825666 RepID=A0AAD9IDC2_9PEZI|nr:hypothetical protein P8C59_008891 [Phyllachora maydis]
MWTVFARCADSVAQGRRLENLSWRLWNRETFCCEQVDELVASATTTLPRDICRPNRVLLEDVPQLSGSVESAMDEEAVEFTSESAPLDIIRPKIQRQDSCTSSRSRGRERHISSDHLEKMVLSIIEAKLPLNAPLPKILPSSSPVDEVTKLDTPPQPERSGSTTPESPCKGSETPSLESPHSSHPPETAASPSSTTVIRGFSPSHHDLHRVAPHHVSRIPSLIVIPEPTEAPAAKTVPPKKQQAKFALGASSGSGDDSYSDAHNSQMCKQPIVQPKKKIFQVGGSSDEDGSVKSDIHPSRANLQLPVAKKTASFNKQPVTRTFHPLRMPSDNEQSETDYIDESAIDDDDDDEWEDSRVSHAILIA